MDFFDKLEDHTRAFLSKSPIVYAIIGGVLVVLFWRGVWHTADILEHEVGGSFLSYFFYEPINMVLSVLGLLVSGLFVSFFIGDTILITGLKKEKKLTERTATEVRQEGDKMDQMSATVKKMIEELHKMHEDIDNLRAKK